MNQSIHTVKNSQVVLTFDKREEGKRFLITLERYRGGKTRNQLAYMFAGVVAQTAKDNGWDKDELYLHLMEQCNKRRSVNPKTGEISLIAAGLSHCRDKWEMASVIDRCCLYLSEVFGYHVPTPEEYFAELEKQSDSRYSEPLRDR